VCRVHAVCPRTAFRCGLWFRGDPDESERWRADMCRDRDAAGCATSSHFARRGVRSWPGGWLLGRSGERRGPRRPTPKTDSDSDSDSDPDSEFRPRPRLRVPTPTPTPKADSEGRDRRRRSTPTSTTDGDSQWPAGIRPRYSESLSAFGFGTRSRRQPRHSQGAGLRPPDRALLDRRGVERGIARRPSRGGGLGVRPRAGRHGRRRASGPGRGHASSTRRQAVNPQAAPPAGEPDRIRSRLASRCPRSI
jgi:hypothetical protein